MEISRYLGMGATEVVTSQKMHEKIIYIIIYKVNITYKNGNDLNEYGACKLRDKNKRF